MAGVLVLICLTLACFPGSEGLAFNRNEVLQGHLWLLWTGHLVHYSTQQLLLDTATLILAGSLAEIEFGLVAALVTVLLGMPAILLGVLMTTPDLLEYRGVSGIVMMFAAMSGVALWRSRPRARGVIVLLAVAFVTKTGFDAMGFNVGSASLPANVRVAWQAHAIGAVFGLLASCVAGIDIRSCRLIAKAKKRSRKRLPFGC